MDKYYGYTLAPTRRLDGVGGLAPPASYSRTAPSGGGWKDGRVPEDELSFNVESVSSYQDYPVARPLLADQIARRKDPEKVRAVPESNSRAVVSALRGLQEKIRKLELERVQAETNLRSLSTETNQYRQALHQQTSHVPAAGGGATSGKQHAHAEAATARDVQEVQTHLSGADQRVPLLEKQLEYMRRMVQSAESDRQAALRAAEARRAQDVSAQRDEVRGQEEKLRRLEQEHTRLVANQTASRGKIEDLERRLEEERKQRKKLLERDAELRTLAETTRILQAAEQIQEESRPRKAKKKKRRAPPRASPPRASPRPSSGPAGRHCTGQIPFVVGKATTPSHSVNANLQNVLALLKTHNTAWCGNGPLAPHRPRPHSTTRGQRSSSVSSSAASDLSDLVSGLQEEFAQMGFEHQDLARQIRETEDSNIREDLERELDRLIDRMEAKGDQITKLKKHQQQIAAKPKRPKTQRIPSVRSAPSRARRTSDPVSSGSAAEVQVITTVKTKGRRAGPIHVANGDTKRVLRDMQTLQTSLRKDDISWE